MNDKNLPYWWLNEESKYMLERGYLLEGQSVEEKIDKICKYASSFYPKEEEKLYKDFKEMIEMGWTSLSSPIWANFGEERSLPISCFSDLIPDFMEGILDTFSEVVMQTKLGGGTSGYFSKLRPLGAPLSGGGVSSGAMSFISWFDAATKVTSQSGVRRGAFAAYLDVEHPEIKEFLRIKDRDYSIQTINNAVCVGDEWMQAMIDGDSDKRDLWANILRSRREKGIPYLFFKDAANNKKPQIYKDRNLEIYSSNLCVSGDTKVLTKNGDKIIKSLVGSSVDIWNGEDWSNVDVKKTGEGQELIRVQVEITYLDDYVEIKHLDCTDYHKWYLLDGAEIRAKDLKVGNQLQNWDTPNSGIKSALITNIENVEGLHDTFCFTEPKRHRGLFNDILTGNCNEIYLPTSEKESFVCCLLSLNLATYDQWKDTDTVARAVKFLDAVMQDFINKSKKIPALKKAHRFAERHRALGIGVLGWHSYLQQNMIPFDSMMAQNLNNLIFQKVRNDAYMESIRLGQQLGYAPIFDEGETTDTKRRHTTLLALAPTTSSSSILGQVSPSIEPYASNYFVAGLAKGSFPRKNVELQRLLTEKGKNTDDVWRSIVENKGSVQHLSFLTDEEKEVFKTFREISPLAIIRQASARQRYIDQGQSINLKIPDSLDIKEINKIHIEAWRLGLKGLYYQRGTSVAKEAAIDLMKCSTCEG